MATTNGRTRGRAWRELQKMSAVLNQGLALSGARVRPVMLKEWGNGRCELWAETKAALGWRRVRVVASAAIPSDDESGWSALLEAWGRAEPFEIRGNPVPAASSTEEMCLKMELAGL